MRQRFLRSLAAAALTVGIFAPSQRAEAAPPILDPAGTVDNAGYNARGTAGDIYMNRNQMLIRITGCEYSARVTNTSNAWDDFLCDDGTGTNPRHWVGSGMGFLENIVNEQLLAATADTSAFAAVNRYDHLDPVAEPIFRNYVDLILKRFLDADTLTPVDFDPATFRMVDNFNPSTTVPVGLSCTGAAAPTTYDTNCDGVQGGWEFGPFGLLSLGCVALPVIGDVCVNTHLINVDPNQTKAFYPVGTTYLTAGPTAVPAGTPVNNIAAPLVTFDSYDPNNQAGTSHLFIAGQAQFDKSFDAELVGCDGPILKVDAPGAGGCNANPYRDDDDGLYVELALTNFKLGLLFEPPMTTSAYGTSQETDNVWNGDAGNEDRHNAALNMRDIPENGTVLASFPCPDGTAISVTDETSPNYDPACDLSRYLKATGEAMIPLVRLGASVRIVSAYNYFSPVEQGYSTVTGYSITLGLELQSLELDAQFQFNFYAGPYCTDLNQGQDYVGVFYDRTDVINNCVVGQGQDTNTIADDMTYLVSEQFTETFPWLRAELSGRFADLFDPTTNPGWFIGPTQLFDVAEVLADLSFDHPLAATSAQWVTDAIYLQAMLDTNVDNTTMISDLVAADGGVAYGPFPQGTGANIAAIRGDNNAEFWADPWGVMIPLNASLGIYFAQGVSAGTEMVSCVTADAAYTGYVDGYGNGYDADDPYVSRPLPKMDMNWSGSGAAWPAITDPTQPVVVGTNDSAEYDSMLLHLKIPNVNGSTPFTNPTDLAAAQAIVPATDVTNRSNEPVETYAFGLALHQNVLSKVLYEAVIDGLLCLDFDAYTGKEELQRTIGDILTTDLFGFFVPYLADQYPGEQMAIRIIPLLQNPQGQGYLKSAADYPSKVSQYIGAFSGGVYDASAGVTEQNPIPRIITGGINQYDELKRRFTGEIESLSIQDFWPDLSIVIPHLLAEFYVWDTSGGTPIRKRAFALDLGINVGLNIDIIQDIARTGGTQAVTPLEAGGFPIARPTYAGTDFPIGCRDDIAGFPYPCEVTGVPSRWVLFLGGLLDPELNAVLVYDEMAFAITDFAGNVSYNTGLQDADPAGGYAAYEDAISNLIGVLLSGELSAFAEVGVDLAALVNLPIVISVPYIGPSFVWNDSASTVVPDGPNNGAQFPDSVECGEEGVLGSCEDPIFDTVGGADIARDVSDGDLNGFGDYLVVAAGLDLSYLTSNYLLRFIDSFVEPLGMELLDGLALGYEYCDGIDGNSNPVTNIPCISETFNNTLLDLVGGLGGAPAAYGARQGFPRGYESPETIIKGVHKAHALETVIEFEGWHPSVAADKLTYSYRVDGGLWTPFVPASAARIPGLLEGRHVFEIRAKDPKGNVEYTPERIEFVVDSVAPRISILGDRVQSGRASFVVDVRDVQTLPEDVRVSWRLNDGEWSEYSARKEVRFDAPVGQHTLQVRAMDEAGNVGVSTLTVAVEDGGFGCAATTGTGSKGLLDLAVMLLLPALVVLRRRRA